MSNSEYALKLRKIFQKRKKLQNEQMLQIRRQYDQMVDYGVPIKAVVFDIGGVLAKTSKKRFLRMVVHNDAEYIKLLPVINKYWKYYRNGLLRESEYWYKIISQTHLVELILKSTSSCQTCKKIRKKFQKGTLNIRKVIKVLKKQYRKKFIVFTKIFPVLEFLKQKNITLGIISNHSTKWVNHLWKISQGLHDNDNDDIFSIERPNKNWPNNSKKPKSPVRSQKKLLSFSKYFVHKELNVISDDVGISKPNRKIFDIFLKRLSGVVGNDVQGKEILYIDDKKTNVKTARKIGWNAIRFDGEINCVKVLLENIQFYLKHNE